MLTGMDQPIGLLLKQADAALTSALNAALAAHDLPRHQWQVLRTIARRGPLAEGDLAAAVRPFAAEAPTAPLVADLVARGWLRRDGPVLRLTDLGERRHAEVAEAVDGVRARAVQGIPAEDYVRVLRTLERIVANLGGAG